MSCSIVRISVTVKLFFYGNIFIDSERVEFVLNLCRSICVLDMLLVSSLLSVQFEV